MITWCGKKAHSSSQCPHPVVSRPPEDDASVFSLGRLLWREKMAKGLQSIFAMPWGLGEKGWMCFSESSIRLLLLLLMLFQICYSNISIFCPSSWEKTLQAKIQSAWTNHRGLFSDTNMICLKSDVCPQDQTSEKMNWEKNELTVNMSILFNTTSVLSLDMHFSFYTMHGSLCRTKINHVDLGYVWNFCFIIWKVPFNSLVVEPTQLKHIN